MKVLVVGASGGSGLAVVSALVANGHTVTAFARRSGQLQGVANQPHCVSGDAMDATALDQAVAGQDAVVVTLGIRENALRVRLMGSAGTAMDVRSRGTRNVIAAMRRHGVRRLLVQTSYGVGPTRDCLPLGYRLMFALVLKPQIADTELQEREVRNSGLDWLIVQPVGLSDAIRDAQPYASCNGQTLSMTVSRQQLGRYFVDALQRSDLVGQTIALSAARVP